MNKNINPDFERRYVGLTMRAVGDQQKPVIEGEAAVFNVETVVGRWFREKSCLVRSLESSLKSQM